MKKILILTLTLFLLPLAVFAQGNKPLSQWEQKMQKRNEQILQRLQMLSRAYNRIEKADVKEKISKGIDMEVEHWYSENMQTVTKMEQEQAMKEGKTIKDLSNIKQQLATEIKAGKMPELMLKTVSNQAAEQFKQRAEMRPSQVNKTPTKQTKKGFSLFKK